MEKTMVVFHQPIDSPAASRGSAMKLIVACRESRMLDKNLHARRKAHLEQDTGEGQSSAELVHHSWFS